MSDQRIEKWTRWLEQPIKPSVLQMHLHRATWREVAEILHDNGQLPDSYWWEFMFDTYATTQAVAVRRLADVHQGVASLGKLITEIRDDEQNRITSVFWMGLWGANEHHGFAERTWNECYAGSTGTHLDPAVPTADFESLRVASESVKHYVDKHVAHADAGAVSAEVTTRLEDVHDAIDVIGCLFRKYDRLHREAEPERGEPEACRHAVARGRDSRRAVRTPVGRRTTCQVGRRAEQPTRGKKPAANVASQPEREQVRDAQHRARLATLAARRAVTPTNCRSVPKSRAPGRRLSSPPGAPAPGRCSS